MGNERGTAQPSKYDPFVRELLQGLQADAAIVVVVGGVVGNGAGRAERLLDPERQAELRMVQVRILRMLADDIEKGLTPTDQELLKRASS